MRPVGAFGIFSLVLSSLPEVALAQRSTRPHPYGGGENAYRYQRNYGSPNYGGYGPASPVQSFVIGGAYPVYGPGFYAPYASYGAFYGSSFGLSGGYWFGAGPSNFWYGPAGPVAFGVPGYGANSYTYIAGGYPGGLYVPTTVDPGLAGLPAEENPLLADAWRENQQRWQQPLPQADPRPDPTQRPAMPSTAEGRRRSLQARLQGDERLRQQQWGLAAERYRRAVETADDQADNHIRLGVALAAQNQLELASREFRRAVFVDRQIAQTAPRLSELLGPDSDLVRLTLISRLTSWVDEDIRNPDRLWVLGVMLHLSDDPRAAEILEAGYRLAGGGDYFLAFVNPAPEAAGPGLPAAPAPAAGQGPKVIEIAPPARPGLEPPPLPGIVPEAELPPAPAPAEIPQGPANSRPAGVDRLPPLPR